MQPSDDLFWPVMADLEQHETRWLVDFIGLRALALAFVGEEKMGTALLTAVLSPDELAEWQRWHASRPMVQIAMFREQRGVIERLIRHRQWMIEQSAAPRSDQVSSAGSGIDEAVTRGSG